jgi:hypothetical protein
MKASSEVGVEIHILLISTLVGVEWSASTSDRFTPGNEALFIYFIGGKSNELIGN